MYVRLLLLPGRDLIVIAPHPPTPFQIRRLECYTDQGKIINCPFVLAAISTGENELMVMKPYHVWFRQWVWCALPSSGVELSRRGSPLWAEACSQLTEIQHILMLKCCCCLPHCFQTLHISYLEHLLTNNTCMWREPKAVIHFILRVGILMYLQFQYLSFIHFPASKQMWWTIVSSIIVPLLWNQQIFSKSRDITLYLVIWVRM